MCVCVSLCVCVCVCGWVGGGGGLRAGTSEGLAAALYLRVKEWTRNCSEEGKKSLWKSGHSHVRQAHRRTRLFWTFDCSAYTYSLCSLRLADVYVETDCLRTGDAGAALQSGAGMTYFFVGQPGSQRPPWVPSTKSRWGFFPIGFCSYRRK